MCVWYAPLIMMGVSAAASAYTAHGEASAKNMQADYNAQVAQNNADISRQNGGYAQAQAARNAAGKRLETGQSVGRQRAKMGASGAVADSGSFMDVTMDTAAIGERDAVNMLHQGDVEAWRMENEARNYDAQKKLTLAGKVDPGMAVAGSLLSSAVQMGTSYFNLKQYAGGGDSPRPDTKSTGVTHNLSNSELIPGVEHIVGKGSR